MNSPLLIGGINLNPFGYISAREGRSAVVAGHSDISDLIGGRMAYRNVEAPLASLKCDEDGVDNGDGYGLPVDEV